MEIRKEKEKEKNKNTYEVLEGVVSVNGPIVKARWEGGRRIAT